MKCRCFRLTEFQKLLLALLIIGGFILVYLSGCSPYAKAFSKSPPKPVMKSTSVSNAARMVIEREGNRESAFDDTENLFIPPEELRL